MLTPIQRIDYWNLSHFPRDYVPEAHALRRELYVPITIPIGIVRKEIQFSIEGEISMQEYIGILKAYPDARVKPVYSGWSDDEDADGFWTTRFYQDRPQTQEEALEAIRKKSAEQISNRESELRLLQSLKEKYGG